MKKVLNFFSYLIAIIVIIIGVTFAYLNAGNVMFNYYLGRVALPLSLILVLALGLGILLGCFAAVPKWLKLNRENNKLKKKLKDL